MIHVRNLTDRQGIRIAAIYARPDGRLAITDIVAKLGFKAHPHMLRHACGYALANKGHDTRALQAYLGHKNIQHTVRYTELVPTRSKDFWRR
jgi:site-specific recombinase XerD